MRRVEVEHWTILVADRVKAGEPIEDSRVEVKGEWPGPVSAARRIAGHANAAHGEEILWIVGLDEKRGVRGAVANDLAKWSQQLQSQLEGQTPAIQHFIVPYEGTSLVALLIETVGAPFVVKNPVFGKQDGGQ